MSDIPSEIANFLDDQRVGALGTVSNSGRPRQSVVYYVREGDRILISTVRDRWKARDVERTGWASLCVRGDEQPFPSATVAGPARIRTEGIGPATAALVQRITGSDEPPDEQSDAALAELGRVILEIEIERIGPVSHLEAAG